MANTLRLPESLDVGSVRQVYQALNEARGADGDLVLDGTGVERVDVAGGQLLAALALSGCRYRLRASAALEEFLAATALSVVVPQER